MFANFLNIFLVNLLATALAVAGEARSDAEISTSLISRPIFSRERVFFNQGLKDAESLSASSPAQIFYFREAQKHCSLKPPEAALILSGLLNPDQSSLISSLKKYLPDIDPGGLSKIRVVIDYYGEQATTFRGFYTPDLDGFSVISLDCRQASPLQWAGVLAHELVHHFSKERPIANWIQEMIGQMVEAENSLSLPNLRLAALAQSATSPSFFSSHHGLESSSQYAANLLFGLYLKRLLGPEIFLQFPDRVMTLEDLSIFLVQYASQKPHLQWLKPFLSPEGLIQHFHLALAINLPLVNGGAIFQVPGWKKFESEISSPEQFVLMPGAAIRVTTETLSRLSISQLDQMRKQGLAVYQITKDATRFRIDPPTQQSGILLADTFVILINTNLKNALNVEIE